jgi:hypothetical protein
VVSRFFSKRAFAESPTPTPKRVFGKGPAFVYLQLHSSEHVNHNTKRLCFKLPGGENAQSGLDLTCKFVSGFSHAMLIIGLQGTVSCSSDLLQTCR